MSKKKNCLTLQDVINKLKNKDFEITYNQAIDLAAVMNVNYHWQEFLGKRENKLMWIELGDYSDVKLHIKEDMNGN